MIEKKINSAVGKTNCAGAVSANFLVESALLTHGLASVSQKELLETWDLELPCITWLERGEIRIGTMEEFLPFRARANEIKRVSSSGLDEAAAAGRDGALTASATMLAASRREIAVAVTCGMGGIGTICGEELCPDLPAVRDLPVTLIAATPKDVVDIEATLRWFREEKVPVYGRYSDEDSGFMAVGKRHRLDGVWDGAYPSAPLLLLNPIEEEKRLKIPDAVERAMEAGRLAEERGEAFHPAANAEFDRLSGGLSSRLQLGQLLENARWAMELTGNKPNTGAEAGNGGRHEK